MKWALGRLRELLPRTPILILTVHGEDRHVFDALCTGACGYLLKDVEPVSGDRGSILDERSHAGSNHGHSESGDDTSKLYGRFRESGC
jgi:hypothetical protein